MRKSQPASQVAPAGDRDPVPPRGLSKSEKADFRRVCAVRRQAGNPVREIEADIVADYVQTRARLSIWQKKLKHGQGFTRDGWGTREDHERMHLTEQLPLAATLDRTAAACRRLARDLKLVG